MNLSSLLRYPSVVIQCHDNPDADTLASGYALYTFFDAHLKPVRLIYSGSLMITKPNLILMIDKLGIPIEYVKQLEPPDLLVTVDCQYGNSNVTPFEAKEICMIDHHMESDFETPLQDIRPYTGSCSTIMWDLLRYANFPLDRYTKVRTALYYGLLTDTNFLSEAPHPLDRDMAETITYDAGLIRQFRNTNLSLSDLKTAGLALMHCSLNPTDKAAILETRPCDPNILGFISDLAIQVDHIHTCVVFFENDEGIKFSVRSCVKEVRANEFASFLCDHMGSGGGKIDKAGGFISSKAFYDKYPGLTVSAFFHQITKIYFESFDIIYADNYKAHIEEMALYSKKKLPMGFVCTTDIFKENTALCVRTLSGDIDILTSPNTYLLVESNGKVQPIHKNTFLNNYQPLEVLFDLPVQYMPLIKNKDSGLSLTLSYYLKECLPTHHAKVFATPLTKNLKIFTLWNPEQYLSGYVGDYIVIRSTDLKDLYIETKERFHESYLPMDDFNDSEMKNEA